MPTSDEALKKLYANYYPSNEDVLMGDPGTAPLGALAPIAMKSFFPKFLRLSKEIPFEERTAIAKAVPEYIKSIVGNKAYDFSGSDSLDLMKQLAKLPSRYAGKTNLLDLAKSNPNDIIDYLRSILKNTGIGTSHKVQTSVAPAYDALKFGGRTGTANLYAALVKTMRESGMERPFNEVKKLLEFAGYAGIK